MVKKLNTGERMAVIETKVDNIEIHLKQQSTTLAKIDTKLDNAIKEHQAIMDCKADKQEVYTLREKINKIIFTGMSTLIFILVGIVGFFIVEIFFRGG